jgi:hypothetical protein
LLQHMHLQLLVRRPSFQPHFQNILSACLRHSLREMIHRSDKQRSSYTFASSVAQHRANYLDSWLACMWSTVLQAIHMGLGLERDGEFSARSEQHSNTALFSNILTLLVAREDFNKSWWDTQRFPKRRRKIPLNDYVYSICLISRPCLSTPSFSPPTRCQQLLSKFDQSFTFPVHNSCGLLASHKCIFTLNNFVFYNLVWNYLGC